MESPEFPLPDHVGAWAVNSRFVDMQYMLEALARQHGLDQLDQVMNLVRLAANPESNPFAIPPTPSPQLAESEPYDALWFSLVRGALVFFIGESGAGKTSLLYNIALHAALGKDLFDQSMKQTNVLYIDPENAGNNRVVKLDRIGLGRPENLVWYDGFNVDLSQPSHLEGLKQRILSDEIGLVILDPLLNLFATDDENDNAEAGRQMMALQRAAKDTNACIVLVHHTGKGENSIFGRGATARLGCADTGILYRTNSIRDSKNDHDDTYDATKASSRFDQVRYQIVKNRVGPYGSLFLQMAGNDRFDVSRYQDWQDASNAGSAKYERVKDSLQTRIVEYNKSYSEESLIRQVIEEEGEHGVGRNMVRTRLADLVYGGYLIAKPNDRGQMFYRRATAEEVQARREAGQPLAEALTTPPVSATSRPAVSAPAATLPALTTDADQRSFAMVEAFMASADSLPDSAFE